MEMIFLGTGAAEGSPAAYCRCDTCRGVRQRSGVELRTRSCLRIGPHHQIDLGPDSYFQMIRAGTDLYDVEHVLVTHSHADHFSLQALLDKQMSRETNRKPIRLYMSAPARTYIEGHLAGLDMSPGDNRDPGARIWERLSCHRGVRRATHRDLVRTLLDRWSNMA